MAEQLPVAPDMTNRFTVVSADAGSSARGGASWIAIGVVGIAAGLALNANLGASLTGSRMILGLWLAVTAGSTIGRWWIDPTRSPLLLGSGLVGLSLAAIVALGGVLPLDGIKAVVATFWIGAGALELAAWANDGRPTRQSPWISMASLLAGVVTITFPSRLVIAFTLVAGMWALLFGLACLVRGVWLLAVVWRRPRVAASRAGQIASIAVPTLLLVAASLGYGYVMANTREGRGVQADLAPFYEVPPDLAPGRPGSIIRSQAIDVPGLRGVARRVLFRSEDAIGRPTVSPGMVFAPAGDGGDRPVVAWAHGTVGLGPTCAPSRDAHVLAHTPFFNDMIDRGWVITAPDYAGAGGTGVGEKYAIVAEQGRDVLNAVRAARAVPGVGAGDRYATYGESQGGLIALAAGALGASYAPEFTLVAIGGVASPSDLGTTMKLNVDKPLLGWLLGTHLVRAWTRQYPHLDPEPFLSDAGREHFAEVADNGCVFDPLNALMSSRMGTFLVGDPTASPEWRAAFAANKAPLPPDNVPVFIGHGLADPLIDPGISARLVERYCSAGARVTTLWMPGEGHIGSSNTAAPTYITWLADRLSGVTAPSNCGDALPMSPASELQ